MWRIKLLKGLGIVHAFASFCRGKVISQCGQVGLGKFAGRPRVRILGQETGRCVNRVVNAERGLKTVTRDVRKDAVDVTLRGVADDRLRHLG